VVSTERSCCRREQKRERRRWKEPVEKKMAEVEFGERQGRKKAGRSRMSKETRRTKSREC
jgi:hypothetical protein